MSWSRHLGHWLKSCFINNLFSNVNFFLGTTLDMCFTVSNVIFSFPVRKNTFKFFYWFLLTLDYLQMCHLFLNILWFSKCTTFSDFWSHCNIDRGYTSYDLSTFLRFLCLLEKSVHSSVGAVFVFFIGVNWIKFLSCYLSLPCCYRFLFYCLPIIERQVLRYLTILMHLTGSPSIWHTCIWCINV